MLLATFLKDKNLTTEFRKAGLYLFSVQVDEFNTFIKLGLSKNIVSRLIGHRTSLYPVFDKMFVHCIVLKRSNLVPRPDGKDARVNKDNKIDGKKVSFMFRAEKRIKDYLIERKTNHRGEWFEMDVPKMIKIMIDHHFGLGDIRGDGYNCSFNVFTTSIMYRFTRNFHNMIQANDVRRGRSNAKGTDYQWLKPSKQEEPQDKKLIKGIDTDAESEDDEDERS